ncbi:FecR domain-containing protein [Fulvivirgaceae bacterium BMA12]|uniref:FecR domain-containing protein n=1 Tax=Agaribacillus aureus TaxID=3051825 RepID=A0ABT8LAX5_9BACT|nr:FecR domain-containing protein [Fulvivirgaceae bacterium BMA12]
MDYLAFTAEDFASDNSFQNWLFKRNAKDFEFWENWISKNPQKKEEISEAIAILSSFKVQEPEVSQTQIDNSWQKMEEILEIGDEESGGETPRHWIRYRYGYAAAVSLLLAVAVIYQVFFRDRLVIYTTDFGETASITLPDNSVVTLNSNSTLKYNTVWDDDKDREVWLNGEAYFSVVKSGSNQKFYVNSRDGVLLEVLGTEFNVTKRESRTRVVLNHGKIRLNIENPSLNEDIIMLPGELVEFKDTSTTYIRKKVNPELYTSWKCKKLMFEDTKLEEVVLLLKEIYGLEVEVSEPALLEKRVSGSAPSDNINLLINGLSESFGITIIRTKKHVKISRK